MPITLFGTVTDSVIPKMIDISAILRPTTSTTTNKRKKYSYDQTEYVNRSRSRSTGKEADMPREKKIYDKQTKKKTK